MLIRAAWVFVELLIVLDEASEISEAWKRESRLLTSKFEGRSSLRICNPAALGKPNLLCRHSLCENLEELGAELAVEHGDGSVETPVGCDDNDVSHALDP